MARTYDPHKLASPRVYLLSMLVFIALVSFLALILYRQIISAFTTNPGLNGLILGVLIVGILLAFMQVIRLIPEVSWVNSFRLGNVSERKRKPVLLAPMEAMLGPNANVALSTSSTQSILDSVGNRLDERREISRYLISLLVFLGLLGTFWGLLGTIGSIGDTIGSLDPSSGNTNDILDALKSGLKAPLDGMGTAFSSSLFGLAGSLVLGFLDLQSSQAQNRFYLELENWLSSLTDLNSEFASSIADGKNVTQAMEKLVSQVKEGGGGTRTTAAMANLAEGIQNLVRHMRGEQQMMRDWVESQSQSQEDIKKLLAQLNRVLNKAVPKTNPATKPPAQQTRPQSSQTGPQTGPQTGIQTGTLRPKDEG